jgi:hypothetical protein
MRIGVGQSAKMLLRQKDLLKKLLQLKPYQPDELLEGLAPYIADEDLDIPGFHLFSFNDIERTEIWRREAIARYNPADEILAVPDSPSIVATNSDNGGSPSGKCDPGMLIDNDMTLSRKNNHD